MAPELAAVMQGLIEDHRRGRELIGRLAGGLERYRGGDSGGLEGVNEAIDGLTELYPRHIHTEDHVFFVPAVRYLTADEQAAMLREFEEFDASLIHKRYEAVARRLEETATSLASRR